MKFAIRSPREREAGCVAVHLTLAGALQQLQLVCSTIICARLRESASAPGCDFTQPKSLVGFKVAKYQRCSCSEERGKHFRVNTRIVVTALVTATALLSLTLCAVGRV